VTKISAKNIELIYECPETGEMVEVNFVPQWASVLDEEGEIFIDVHCPYCGEHHNIKLN
jgi:hypothetical protein